MTSWTLSTLIVGPEKKLRVSDYVNYWETLGPDDLNQHKRIWWALLIGNYIKYMASSILEADAYRLHLVHPLHRTLSLSVNSVANPAHHIISIIGGCPYRFYISTRQCECSSHQCFLQFALVEWLPTVDMAWPLARPFKTFVLDVLCRPHLGSIVQAALYLEAICPKDLKLSHQKIMG